MEITELSKGGQEFLAEIREQLPPVAQTLWDAVLKNLGKPSAEDAKRLEKLAYLEAAGVDNWEGYDEALEGYSDDEGDDDDN